jgi:predicted alpha/beta-fold hydrolase
MPIIDSRFKPAPLLGNGHVQTILGALLRRPRNANFERERLELRDGDFLDLRWLRPGRDRLAILSHGLEGSTDQGYIHGTAAALAAARWDVLAWNFRGCGDEPNRLVRLYHSGATEDLGAVVDHAARSYSRIALVGFSLGGNLTLKYIGEAPPHVSVVAAVALSAPVDLAASARMLDQRWSNRIYLRRFIESLVTKVEAKALQFPGEIDARGSRQLRSFREFDDRYTSRLHGFRDAADYWAQASARQFLPRISCPALLLNARNDPFLAPECFPYQEAEQNRWLSLETPQSGGHLGFVERAGAALRPWFERRVVEFVDAVERQLERRR